jgi:hypothetical protein
MSLRQDWDQPSALPNAKELATLADINLAEGNLAAAEEYVRQIYEAYDLAFRTDFEARDGHPL